MTQAFIEHVNLSVRNPSKTSAQMQAIFGWHIRWQGEAQNGGNTIHVGTETHYLALYTNGGVQNRTENWAKGMPLNHVGLQVDDLDATEQRVIAAGLIPFGHDEYAPGNRFYFFDDDGIEFEVVSYENRPS